VNIGKDGLTANAGIPGTGLSYRQKIGRGGKGAWLAVLLVIGGLAVWAFQHLGRIEQTLSSLHPDSHSSTVLSTGSSTDSSTGSSTRDAGLSTQASNSSVSPVNASGNMQRFVHRQGAILRDEPRASGHILIKESKGSAVTLVSEEGDGWSKVTAGKVTGYMRSSVLGLEPPP
jgi:cytoskeletal protein RodZ